MSSLINNIINNNRKTFFSRHDELKIFMETYFKDFVENHEFIEVNRVNATDRLSLAGYYEDLSGWQVRGELTISSCELLKGERARYDYNFIFKYVEKKKVSRIETTDDKKVANIEANTQEKKAWKDFTDEEKEAYRKQKEIEKKEIKDTFEDFLKTQTFKEIVDLIDKNSRLQSIADQKLPNTELEAGEEIDDWKMQRIEEVKEIQKIHGYSIRNYLLVLSQARKRQDENFMGVINSYWRWKRQGAQVQRRKDNSKPYSYKILVPVMKKGALVGFKLGSVFDISQTNKSEEFLKKNEELENNLKTVEEIEYGVAKRFIQEKFPEIIIEENGQKTNDGLNYNAENHSIIIKKKTSHEAFHGLGYHLALELDLINNDSVDLDKKEILAEVTCYILMKKFETDPNYKINYNFGDSHIWALDILEKFKFGEFEKVYNTLTEYVNDL